MRKLFFMLLLAATTILNCQALTVNNTAGGLSGAVNDVNITVLKVVGTMDARDFRFITESLNEITTLDLSDATIVPYNNSKAVYGTVTFYYENEIPRTAFFGKKLTTVSLPEGLQTIGYAAFAGCYQLRSITLPESLTYIDDYAFAGSGLTSVVIPRTVTGMGKGVFSRCESMTSAVVNCLMLNSFTFLGDVSLSNVQLGADVKFISEGAFNGCKALKTITADPACRLNHIGDEAFINSGLESINLKSLGLGTIGDWALAQTNLTSIELADGMTNLGAGALANNLSLTDVVFPGNAHHGGRRGAPVQHNPVPEVKDFTFAGDAQLNAGSMLPEGIVTIGNYALYNVSASIDTMRLPSTVEYLGDYAMAGMTGMQVLKTAAEDVPALGNEVWAGVDQPSVPLITPSQQSTANYKAASQWADFFFEADPYLLGDVNNDGSVTITDVTVLIDYLLNSSIDINLQAADVSQDGDVSIADVTALIDMLLSGNSKMSLNSIRMKAAVNSQVTSDVLASQSVALRPGETRTVDVALNNTEHDYIAMQCELVLPQGVALTGANGIDRGSKHSYYTRQNEVEDNVYSLIGVSMHMNTYAGDEGNILRLTITASDDFDAQSAELVFTNVLLVGTHHEAYLAADAVGRINNSSSVEQITADKQIANVRYVNVAGQESETPFDGINIVVTTYTDGTMTTVKVIK